MLNVYFDTDDNSGTGYQISSASGADYLLQGHELYEYSGAAGGWGWTALGTVPYVSNGVIAEMAIDRAIIGDPSLLNVVLIGDNASLIVPGNQEDLYPDTLNDNASSQRAFSYNTGGNASSPSTTPLSAPTVTSDVIVTSSRLRYVNAIQPSADTLRQTTGAARTATSTVSTGGSASIIMIFLNLLLWISRAAARGSVFVSEQRQGRHGQVFDKA